MATGFILLVLITTAVAQPKAKVPGHATAAPKPLYRDPVHDGAADPSLIWNRAEKKWMMFYTNRRADVPKSHPQRCRLGSWNANRDCRVEGCRRHLEVRGHREDPLWKSRLHVLGAGRARFGTITSITCFLPSSRALFTIGMRRVKSFIYQQGSSQLEIPIEAELIF